ncbi:MAG: GTPase Era [Acidithiobacillales bacterium SM1_46]|jgi:GTP-binding protein Era|nr:MAG: GTPase Era [Acidithiobacillales bacterium SM1_46]
MTAVFRSGLVTLVGRPNVGKSTLLNQLLGRHLSISSRRPQTTRHRILGIKTLSDAQIVYVDTPGLHPETTKPLNRYMNRVARASLEGVDCIVLVTSAGRWKGEDDYPLGLVQQLHQPVVLVINKIDRLASRAELLPMIDRLRAKMNFAAVVPLSAKTGENVSELERVVRAYLPEQPPIYPADQVTDRSESDIAAEIVREQIFRRYGQEVPYASAVQVEGLRRVKGVMEIDAVIWVEKEGQKAILVGKGGESLKIVGREARLVMQRLFGCKVRLGLWVKVRAGWSASERSLQALGYREDH